MPFVARLATMAIENTVSSNFDPRSSIVKSVFDCRLSGVENVLSIIEDGVLILHDKTDVGHDFRNDWLFRLSYKKVIFFILQQF